MFQFVLREPQPDLSHELLQLLVQYVVPEQIFDRLLAPFLAILHESFYTLVADCLELRRTVVKLHVMNHL